MALCGEPTCLGLPEWTDCCYKKKKARTEASGSNERFTDFVTDCELEKLAKGFAPKNTVTSTNWAVKNFEAWERARNCRFPSETVPEHLLQVTEKLLGVWLSRYIVETRNAKGDPYPLSTCYQLLSGVLRSMRADNPPSDSPIATCRTKSTVYGLFTSILPVV